MKVLKIIHTLGHGGAENTFRRLAWGLNQAGVEVVAAIPVVSEPQAENWVASALTELEVPYLTYDSIGTPWNLLKNLSHLIDLVRPDVVHSHLVDSNFYSALVCRWHSVPHICTEHGDVSLKQRVATRAKYGTISLCSHFIVCVSRAVQEKVAKRALLKNRLRTIYNGIHFLEKTQSSFRSEFGISEDAILIGNVGNLYRVKGQEFLIRAFAKLSTSYPKAILIFVGRGQEENRLKELLVNLNIPQNRVLFTGFRRDIENVMNSFDLYVHPSISEGHPLAVLEAMSLGIPVIASSVGGIPEIIGENEYGVLVRPASCEDLHECIQDYLWHPELFMEKAGYARNYVRHTFSIEKMVCEYLSIYEQVLKLNRK